MLNTLILCQLFCVFNFVAPLAKVDKQKESEEPQSYLPKTPPITLIVPPCERTEYKKSITQLLNMI